jgi:hypothetical protein
MSRHYRPLPPPKTYVLRIARRASIALGIMAAALGVGMLGYHGLQLESLLSSVRTSVDELHVRRRHTR